MLHTQNVTKNFASLQDLAKSIPTDSKNKLRLAPSNYDKAPLLLLCLPESQLTVVKSASVDIEMALRQKPPQIIDPTDELRKYIRKFKDQILPTQLTNFTYRYGENNRKWNHQKDASGLGAAKRHQIGSHAENFKFQGSFECKTTFRL